jgi:hypothetical protein
VEGCRDAGHQKEQVSKYQVPQPVLALQSQKWTWIIFCSSCVRWVTIGDFVAGRKDCKINPSCLDEYPYCSRSRYRLSFNFQPFIVYTFLSTSRHSILGCHKATQHLIYLRIQSRPRYPIMEVPRQASSPESSTAESGGLASSRKPAFRRLTDHLDREIDSKACSPISVYACFLTGYTAAISFSACYVWCGFQT